MKLWATPSISTSSWSFDAPIVVVAASGDVPETVAPEDDCVTASVWVPAARPEPASNDAMPTAAPPEPIRSEPDATMSFGDATVPAEIWVDPMASWSTAKVSEPVWVPELTFAVADRGFEDVAAIRLVEGGWKGQGVGRLLEREELCVDGLIVGDLVGDRRLLGLQVGERLLVHRHLRADDRLRVQPGDQA